MAKSYLDPIREKLLASQGGTCAICGTSKATKLETPGVPHTFKKWAVDHCHATGFIRGVLCRSCNSKLGIHGENLKALATRLPGAVEYLQRPHTGIPYRP